MTSRLPFTLTPLPGEPFALWWQTYAQMLHTTGTDLATAAGTAADPDPAQIAAATGATVQQVAALLAEPAPPPHLIKALAWTGTSRFCPACLTDADGWPKPWRQPTSFCCPRHRRLLASACPGCGRTLTAKLGAGPACPYPGCGADLRRARTRAADDAHLAAQHHIGTLTGVLRDRHVDDQQRHEAINTLADLILIAIHHWRQSAGRTSGHLPPGAAAALTAADTLTHPTADTDRALAALVNASASGPRGIARPASWRHASSALTARIARIRDADLLPGERLRHASTLSRTPPRPRAVDDPGLRRAAKLPDQLWPDWAIRLADDDDLNTIHFRMAMTAALLLPGSKLQFKNLVKALPAKINAWSAAHQLRRLDASPHATLSLRILTELAFALDEHDIPIDYNRRRAIATRVDLFDTDARAATRGLAGIRFGSHRRTRLTRSYLYELITGGHIATAPQPYRIDKGTDRADYHEFVTLMPKTLADHLAEHARAILEANGASHEPLRWSPPTDWISSRLWPGAEPDATDPQRIHQAVIANWAGRTEHFAATGHVADSLGISTEHLRYVLRAHPLTRQPFDPQRPGSIVAHHDPHQPAHYTTNPTGRCKPVFHVNLAWLDQEYTGWNRTIADIAAEIGCVEATLKLFAKSHGIALRPRSGGHTYIPSNTLLRHPSQIPEPLRSAISGPNAIKRLRRFLDLIDQPSATHAAKAAGTTPSAVITQLHNLERRCGGYLLQRRPRPHPLGRPTPLGEQLREQALNYLNGTDQ